MPASELFWILVIAAVTAVSALFIKMGVRLVAKRSVNFLGAFVISGISLLGAFLIHGLVRRLFGLELSSLAFLAAFFLLSWVLNARFINFGTEESRPNYLQWFLVTFVQCVLLAIVGAVFFIVSIAVFTIEGSGS